MNCNYFNLITFFLNCLSTLDNNFCVKDLFETQILAEFIF